MGGALATLAAVDLHEEFPNLCISTYTFGSPRVGDAAFAERVYPRAICGVSHRYTHGRDLVPRNPPRAAGFVHIGREMYDNNGAIRSDCDGPGRVPRSDNARCIRSVRRTALRFTPDHVSYLDIPFNHEVMCQQAPQRRAN